jgi:hypothetical protein
MDHCRCGRLDAKKGEVILVGTPVETLEGFLVLVNFCKPFVLLVELTSTYLESSKIKGKPLNPHEYWSCTIFLLQRRPMKYTGIHHFIMDGMMDGKLESQTDLTRWGEVNLWDGKKEGIRIKPYRRLRSETSGKVSTAMETAYISAWMAQERGAGYFEPLSRANAATSAWAACRLCPLLKPERKR